MPEDDVILDNEKTFQDARFIGRTIVGISDAMAAGAGNESRTCAHAVATVAKYKVLVVPVVGEKG